MFYQYAEKKLSMTYLPSCKMLTMNISSKCSLTTCCVHFPNNIHSIHTIFTCSSQSMIELLYYGTL